MLDFKAPAGFQGWGCVQCGLALEGAIALLCDRCVELQPLPPLKFICAGTYVMQGVRIGYADFPRHPHEHDLNRHPEVRIP